MFNPSTISTLAGLLTAGTALLVLSSPAIVYGQDKVTTCPAPYGTIAINEPSQDSLNYLYSLNKLGSPSSLLRVFAQESNCFIVVERGRGMENMKEERALAGSGELQGGQNIGKGQMIAADYMMTPSIQGANSNAGGVGGVVGGRLGRVGGVVGGGLKTREAQTSIVVASVRTGVQVAAAEGAATKRDFGLGGFGVAGALLGAGGYTNTAEGKMIAASLMDNFNKVIASVAGNPNVRPMSADRIAAVTGGEAPKAGAMKEGDVVTPKIDVRMLKTAADSAALVATVKRGEDLVYLGEEDGAYIKVAGNGGEGWVRKSLVSPKQ